MDADRARRSGRRGPATGFERRADRHAVGRPAPARPVRTPAAAGRAADPARRAVHRASTPARPRDLLAWSTAGMARAAPSSRCCTTSSWYASISPRPCCSRASRSAGARRAEVLTAGQSPARAPAMTRPGRPSSGDACRAAATRHDPLRPSARAVRRFRLHAPGAGRLRSRWRWAPPARRVPDAAPDEPDRRCDGARHPARRCGRLPRGRPVAAWR